MRGLVRNSGKILLESVPNGINLDDVKHDLESVRHSPAVTIAIPDLTLTMNSRYRVSGPFMSYTSGA